MRINNQYEIQIQKYNNFLAALVLLTAEIIHIGQQLFNHLIDFDFIVKLLPQQFENGQTLLNNFVFIFELTVLNQFHDCCMKNSISRSHTNDHTTS